MKKTPEVEWHHEWKKNHVEPVSPLSDYLPDWFKEAKTFRANFSYAINCFSWYDGDFNSGNFIGNFTGGNFNENAKFIDGVFHNGSFRGTWIKGRWAGGKWKHKARWEDPTIDRIPYMLSLMGIVFDSKGYAKAYRKTRREGRGCYDYSYIQKPGPFHIKNTVPAGEGVCRPGLHACSAAVALTYFTPKGGDILWEVTFHRKNLMDVDGEKIRLRKGVCKRIKWPFLTDKHIVKS